MKYFISLIVSLMLTLNLVSALAGNHNSKPSKDPGTSAPSSQPGESAGNPQRPSKPPYSGDTDRDRDRKHDGHQDCCDDQPGKDKDRQQNCCDDQSGKGNERSKEMLERRDERKEEKAEYKSDRVPGQEGKSDENKQRENVDKDTKKPWYEFWE
jgi:hypothetical protein